MSRIMKIFGCNQITIALVFILSVLGVSLFSAQKAEAHSVTKYYTIFTRGDGNFIHYSNSGFQWIDWTPQIFIADKYSGTASNDCSGGSFGKLSFNTSHTYTNCRKITIQEDKSTTINNTWFENAWYAYKFGDFDHTEELSTSGGYISDWGSSLNTVDSARQYAISHSGDTDGKCDSPNYNTDDACSVLVLFDPSRAGDFGVTLDNKADSDTHEYRYKFPESNTYYHLYFNANGGSVADSPADSSTLYSHMSGAEVLREYEPGDTADTFPTPDNGGRIFLGWWTAAVGGSQRWSRTMNSDERLYAHWMPYNYQLTPSVTLNPSGAFEAGSPIAVRPSVLNNFPSDPAINTRSAATDWTLSRIILPVSGGLALPDPATAYLGDSVVATTPCTFFKNTYTYTKAASTTCSNPSSSSGVIFPVGTTNLSNYNDYNTDLNVGDKICYALSVQPRSNTNNVPNTNWIHSKPVCAVVGKKPKVQVTGGDLSAGSDTTAVHKVQTSQSVKTGGVFGASPTAKGFGSWVEYAIFSTGTISGIASGSAFANPAVGFPANTSSVPYIATASYNTLSFTRTCGSLPGCYAPISVPNLAANFPTNTSTPTFSGDFTGKQGVYKAPATLNITGGTIARSQWVVINAPGTDVTISGPISYDNGSLASTSEIPQLVIIARNITINSGVQRVDAWLIANSSASSSIKTCDMVPTKASDCAQQLTVNGPVVTKKLYLYRTYGSEKGMPASGEPAEVFNLRADTFLWSASQFVQTGRIRTVYTTELPPRY